MRPSRSLGLGLSLWLLVGACASDAPYANTPPGERPAHHGPDGFRNPHIPPNPKRGFFAYWRMRLFGDDFPDYATVAHRVPRQALDPVRLHQVEEPQLTWIGQATFLIQLQGRTILTDPQFSDRASPVSFAGPKRLVPLPIQLHELPKVDLVVISHNHYDHLDRDSVEELGNGPRWVVPLGLKQTLVDWGIDAERITELDWWQSAEVAGINLTATPTQHFSARSLFDRNQTLWCSWLIELAGQRLWFGGDTGYNPVQFRQIGERFAPIDWALIPIGAYEPRWFMRDVHANPEEGVQILEDIGARQGVAMHWGTFQLSAEPMLEPPQRIAAEVARRGWGAERFLTPAIGEMIPLRQAPDVQIASEG